MGDESEYLLDKAYSLMEDNKKEEAKKIIEDVVSTNPGDEDINISAVYMYFHANMFKEAKEILVGFKERKGRELSYTIPFSQIEKREKIHKLEVSNNEKIFKRIYVNDHGSYLDFFPVKQIRIGAHYIVIVKRGKEYRYGWEEIIEAGITTKSIPGISKAGETAVQLKRLILKTKDKVFKINVSYIRPGITNPDVLLHEIEAHLKIKRIKLKDEDHEQLYFKIFIVFVVFILIWLLLVFLKNWI